MFKRGLGVVEHLQRILAALAQGLTCSFPAFSETALGTCLQTLRKMISYISRRHRQVLNVIKLLKRGIQSGQRKMHLGRVEAQEVTSFEKGTCKSCAPTKGNCRCRWPRKAERRRDALFPSLNNQLQETIGSRFKVTS